MNGNESQATETYRAPAFADFKPEHLAHGATPERLDHLKEHGFVIINDFLLTTLGFRSLERREDVLQRHVHLKTNMT